MIFDISPPFGEPGVLMGLIEDSEARMWRRGGAGPARSRARLLRPVLWPGGGPARAVRRAGLDGAGVHPRLLRRRIHWAGAECAPQWNGYLEGAVRSGEAVAAAVVAEL
ncbi:MAG: FAD-dependent oxidoreductase [Actinomycetota bacterium]